MDYETKEELMSLLQVISNNVGALATLAHANQHADMFNDIISTNNKIEDYIIQAFRVVKGSDDK